MPKHKIFSNADLLSGLTDKLRAHNEKHFGPSSMLNKVILRKLLECYLAEEALGGLKLLTESKSGYIFNDTNKGPWQSTSDLISAYRHKDGC